MPHMAPIMWAVIMFMTFTLILVLLTMIYFGNSPITPESKKISKESFSSNWLW
uniref:ATP synthase F0 subunit 8 n=1 Tax=Balanus trigonus TaxID=756461 RepID=A0A8E8HWZ3_9CRUS|nr:ATP synthase F0 subunit 8 [Balanus trigonus]QWC93322.1 ATP synthase F0 subunit 8 [Balanus trigonus]